MQRTRIRNFEHATLLAIDPPPTRTSSPNTRETRVCMCVCLCTDQQSSSHTFPAAAAQSDRKPACRAASGAFVCAADAQAKRQIYPGRDWQFAGSPQLEAKDQPRAARSDVAAAAKVSRETTWGLSENRALRAPQQLPCVSSSARGCKLPSPDCQLALCGAMMELGGVWMCELSVRGIDLCNGARGALVATRNLRERFSVLTV